MESPRPLASIVSVVLLEIIALGTLGLGLLLLAVGGELQLGDRTVAVTITAVVSLAFAVLAVIAGIGLWRGRAWGWATGMTVALVGLLGIATAALSSAFQPQLIVGIMLFGGVLACLLVPAVRARSGIG